MNVVTKQIRFEAASLLVAKTAAERASAIEGRVPYTRVGYEPYRTKKALAAAFRSSSVESPFKLYIRTAASSGTILSPASMVDFRLWQAKVVSEMPDQAADSIGEDVLTATAMLRDAQLGTEDARVLLWAMAAFGIGDLQDVRAYFMNYISEDNYVSGLIYS